MLTIFRSSDREERIGDVERTRTMMTSVNSYSEKMGKVRDTSARTFDWLIYHPLTNGWLDGLVEYAQVIKMLGNGRLEAQCFDGEKRLAHIRGKMRKKVCVPKLRSIRSR